jgi:hypothetical protein
VRPSCDLEKSVEQVFAHGSGTLPCQFVARSRTRAILTSPTERLNCGFCLHCYVHAPLRVKLRGRGICSVEEFNAPPRTVAIATDTAASRQRFLRLTAAGAGTLTLGAVLAAGAPRGGLSGTSQNRDAEILNFALVLEELTAAFYARAIAGGALSGELADFAAVAAAHEREHVALIRGALGSKARPAPRFAFGKAVTSPARFAHTASELEELAVAAYNGQAANLSKPALQAAARIISVDARHASWIRAIQGRPPASQATDEPKTRRQVLVEVDRTGFVRS